MIKKYKVAIQAPINLGYYDQVNQKSVILTYKPGEEFTVDYDKINIKGLNDYLTDIFSQEYRGNIDEVGYSYPTVDLEKGSRDIAVTNLDKRQEIVQNKARDLYSAYIDYQRNKDKIKK